MLGCPGTGRHWSSHKEGVNMCIYRYIYIFTYFLYLYIIFIHYLYIYICLVIILCIYIYILYPFHILCIFVDACEYSLNMKWCLYVYFCIGFGCVYRSYSTPIYRGGILVFTARHQRWGWVFTKTWAHNKPWRFCMTAKPGRDVVCNLKIVLKWSHGYGSVATSQKNSRWTSQQFD